MADLILTDTQQFDLAVGFADKKGKPAKIDGTPAWNCSNAAALSVTAAGDGMSATCVALDLADDVQISVEADADLGEGVEPVVGTYLVSIVAGKAVSAVFTPGAPTEQP
jgi:hypothetical protein